MPSPKSPQLTVNSAGNWRLYANTLPSNAVALGTVTRDGIDSGTLVRFSNSGVFMQLNGGSLRSLNQRAVSDALRKAGHLCAGATPPAEETTFPVRITPTIQSEVEGPIEDALRREMAGELDPSDTVYLKIHRAMLAVQRVRPVTIKASHTDLRELYSRADNEIGPTGICSENLADCYEFADRTYWLGRARAYRALFKQVSTHLAAAGENSCPARTIAAPQ